ncbi:MAG: type II toxin-antitoxin system mRNA interferase toxin, RelE/StbE family [Hydrogenophilales bacterium CG_4_10_14_3_um_filter_63_21]|nr:MAG: type II toxin-antitoxin system mRNA interferase toxin, RelE/StbE family [Hydrogenophilales bacterium CG_4_10_14_3_um_filter_63_21]
MRLRWLPEALDDLREIHAYIANENPEAARRVIGEIRREVAILVAQPQTGRFGRLPGSREFVIRKYPYIVAYRIRDEEVQCLLVVHTSRRWPKRLT